MILSSEALVFFIHSTNMCQISTVPHTLCKTLAMETRSDTTLVLELGPLLAHTDLWCELEKGGPPPA